MLVSSVQSRYRKGGGWVREHGSLIVRFMVHVELHHLLIPLLFVIVLEALFKKIMSDCSEELVYGDGLVLVSD